MKTLAAAAAAKVAIACAPIECCCQRPATIQANSTAGTTFSARTNAAKPATAAVNLLQKMSNGLRGSDASARRSRRVGKSDCHWMAVSRPVKQKAKPISQVVSARTRFRYVAW
jgi:hypothetical protein